MNVVVFDLELVKRYRKGQPSEIVEIGACKVDLSSKKMIDQFQIYISPKSGYISKSTRKFINMEKEDMYNSVSFETGIEEFSKWLGEEYYLCSWGKDDKLHIINQCASNKINLDWFKNYNDIQKKIGDILRNDNNNQLGLKNALELAGIESIGKAHRGIDDAINTTQLLINFLDDIDLEENKLSDKEIKHYYRKYKKSRYQHSNHSARKHNKVIKTTNNLI